MGNINTDLGAPLDHFCDIEGGQLFKKQNRSIASHC